MDLGPGSLTVTDSSPFFLSNQEWTALAAYVSTAVNPKIHDGCEQHPQYPVVVALLNQIRGHCLVWTQTGYPTVIGLAADIAQWASQVPARYQGLKDALSLAIGNPSDAKIATAVLLTQQLGASAHAFSLNARAGLGIVQDFLTQCQQDYAMYQAKTGTMWQTTTPDPDALNWMGLWEAVQSQLSGLVQMLSSATGPVQTLQVLEGVWTGLEDSLSDLSTQLSTENPPTSDFLAKLDIDTAIGSWTAVGISASAFVASAHASAG